MFSIKSNLRQFKISETSYTKVEINTLISNFHIDINPSDAGNYDRVVIQNLLKEIGQSMSANTGKFKVLVINHADGLTLEAQSGLRRSMEKYAQSVRIILLCNNLSKII